LLTRSRQAVRDFEQWLDNTGQLRKQVKKRLLKVTAPGNIDFGGLARVSHVTDATDWRVEYPLVVVTPDDELQMQLVVQQCIAAGLTIIARGGGTGYTGAGFYHPLRGRGGNPTCIRSCNGRGSGVCSGSDFTGCQYHWRQRCYECRW